MNSEILIGCLSLAGTLIGSITGILTANKLTSYRIEQLEKKVDKHNTLIERMAVVERDVSAAFRRIDEISEHN